MKTASLTTGKWNRVWAGISPAILYAAIAWGAPNEASAASESLNCASALAKCGYPTAGNTGVVTVIKQKRSKKVIKKKKLRGKKRFKFIKVKFQNIPGDVTSGPGWRWDSRGFVSISGDGAVFRNFIVNGTIDVLGDNVLIDNVRVIVGGETFGIAIRRADNTYINRCMIGPAANMSRLMVGIKDIYGGADNTTINKCNIYGTSTGIQIGRGRILNNFIHDLRAKSGDHLNGITSNGSTGQLIVNHNTILNSADQTDAIGLFQDFGVEANRLIVNNFLAGGGYTIYAGEDPSDRPSYNIKIMNNRFSNIYYSRSGYYGYGTAFNRHGSGNVWSNNIWDHSGSTVPPP